MTVTDETITDPNAATEDAPYGYMKDAVTGEMRPRKRRGRIGNARGEEPVLGSSPSLDDLKTEPRVKVEDTAPGKAGKLPKAPKDDPIPPYRAGVIAKGMTVLYQRAGKMVRVWDRDIGQTIIDCAADCGEGWDELAKVNPRVRRALMKMIKGGAWGQLVMAHLPIGMAILMKDGIRQRLPLGRLFESMAEPDAGTAPGEDASPMTMGLTPEDMEQAMAMAQRQMADMASPRQAPTSAPRAPEPPAPPIPSVEEFIAMQHAQPGGNPPDGTPEAFRRRRR